MSVVPIGLVPRSEALTTVDVTEIDIAAQIRQGSVTWQEVAERMDHPTFAAWMRWRGISVLEAGLKGWRSRCTLKDIISDTE